MKLTPRQASQRAGVSPSLIYQWCEERRLPHFRCGRRGRRGRILIEDTDLDAFLESCKVTAEAAEAPRPRPSPHAGDFKMLDAERLRAAWHRRDGRRDPKGEGNARSSASSCDPSALRGS